MKTLMFVLILFTFFTVIGCAGSHRSSTNGQILFDQAADDDRAGAYITALEQYNRAWPVLLQEGNADLVKQYRLAAKRLGSITNDYSATEQMVRSTLADRFDF